MTPSPISILHLREPFDPDSEIKGFYQVIHAANGTFIRARRTGLHAAIQINEQTHELLHEMKEFVSVARRFPANVLNTIYQSFNTSMPYERLAWVRNDHTIFFPEQEATRGFVVPVDRYHPMLKDVIMDVHSHNSMGAHFSEQDNKDEQSGFRLFMVIGRVGEKPEIRARVGVFGRFMNITPDAVADVPDYLRRM